MFSIVFYFSDLAAAVSDEEKKLNEKKKSSFDKRPFKNSKFPVPVSFKTKKLSKHVAACLIESGYCIIDNILPANEIENVYKEALKLENSGRFSTGKLDGGKTSGEDSSKVVNAKIRSDKITWLQGNELDYPAIGLLIAKMDEIVTGLNPHLHDQTYINGRTKVIIMNIICFSNHYFLSILNIFAVNLN